MPVGRNYLGETSFSARLALVALLGRRGSEASNQGLRFTQGDG